MPDPLPNTLDPARLQQIYSRTAAFYDTVAGEHQARAKERAIDLLARQHGERMMEVGCGTGWAFSRVIASTGVEDAVAVDVAPGMLHVARQRLQEEAGLCCPPLMLADARALPFAEASFDCVLTTYTLEVLPEADILRVLAECHRILRPGGRLVVAHLTEGEGEGDRAITEEWKRGYLADPEYFSGARPLVLTPFLERSGFHVQARHYSGHGQGWPSEVILAR